MRKLISCFKGDNILVANSVLRLKITQMRVKINHEKGLGRKLAQLVLSFSPGSSL